MTRDIAVICASPPGINPGMASVDLGLISLAARHGLTDRLRFHRLYASELSVDDRAGGPLTYSVVSDVAPLFASHAAILFWGDLLHMRRYQLAAANVLLERQLCQTLPEATARVQDLFMLRGQDDDVFGKTLSFGTTMVVNNIQDEMHAEYGPLLERFVKSARRLWFRDVFSAFKACCIRRSYDSPCLGVDCAMLIDAAEIAGDLTTMRRDRVGIFLGRTGNRDYLAAMCSFAIELASRLKLTPDWIRWGDRAAFPSLAAAAAVDEIRTLDAFSPDGAPRVADALAGLKRCRVIVTDTYHVCVNAWSLGVPAICVAENEFSEVRNLHAPNYFARRDKRHVFMSMYDALDFFVATNELVEPEYREKRLAHLVRLLHSGHEVRAVHDRIRTHATASEQSLVTSCLSFLSA